MLVVDFLDPPFIAQDTLKAWQNKNHPWLELSDVHKETTENIRVTVIPFYMGCKESHANSVYWVGNLLSPFHLQHFWNLYDLVALLHPIGELGEPQRTASGKALEDIFIVRNIGNGQR